MSEVEALTQERPRSMRARIVYKSIRRAHWQYLMFAFNAVGALFMVWIGIVDASVRWGFLVAGTALVAMSTCLAIINRRRRDRIERLWYDGELVEVTCYSSGWETRAQAYLCEVKHGDKVAGVWMLDEPDKGAKLPALTDGTWIAVRDVRDGRLQLGRLQQLRAA